MIPELEDRVLAAPRFTINRERARRAAVYGVLPTIVSDTPVESVDWDYSLMCCSFLTGSTREEAQAAVLDISQACLLSDHADAAHRAAAVVMLERIGNRPAIRLAEERDVIGAAIWMAASAPFSIDVLRARLELAVPTSEGDSFPVNRFQRDFWSSAQTNLWISVSAATAAGKSFIVRRWLQEKLAEREFFTCVYLVPTRALIEEVGRDLAAQLGPNVGVRSLPWDAEIGTLDQEVFVFTQERLHLLLEEVPEFKVDLLFVDEAQKFGDDSRGVLLQRVLDETVRRSANCQVVFASPLSANPELLLESAPNGVTTEALTSGTVTVSQNLLWVNQVRGKPQEWTVDLVSAIGEERLGHVSLPARPSPASKRLSLVAIALGGQANSNVVYVNGAAQAETVSSQIYDALGPEADISTDPRVAALQELCEKTIHRSYALNQVLNRGVGFHYGNMPLLVREEIESLFRDGTLRYLVCTSTLLEGVNLPCQNLFVLGPKRGNRNKMDQADFWNLAGRAGRWGKEFAGNIVCIDTNKEDKWPEPPRTRVRYPLSRATDDVMSEVSGLVEYVERGTQPGEGQGQPPFEAVYSFLSAHLLRGESVDTLPGVEHIGEIEKSRLVDVMTASLGNVEIPIELIQRHAGISAVSMQRLLDDFRAHEDVFDLLISPPESGDALPTIVAALGRVKLALGGDFGTPPRQYGLSLLIVKWMRGWSLARIISDRITYEAGKDKPPGLDTIIRGCMNDVEKIARFEAPKYLACYVGILEFHFEQLGIADQLLDMPDVAMLLELGVSRTTELNLIALGMSRTSAIALAEHIVSDELSADDCLAWLDERDIDSLGLPILVNREIVETLERRLGRTTES